MKSIINGLPPPKAGFSSGGTNQDNNMDGHEGQLVIGQRSLGETNWGIAGDPSTNGVERDITFDDNDPDGFVSVDDKNRQRDVDNTITPTVDPSANITTKSDKKEGEEKKDSIVEKEESVTPALLEEQPKKELETDSPAEKGQVEKPTTDS